MSQTLHTRTESGYTKTLSDASANLTDRSVVIFYVLLTVHLSVILVINQLNAQIFLL